MGPCCLEIKVQCKVRSVSITFGTYKANVEPEIPRRFFRVREEIPKLDETKLICEGLKNELIIDHQASTKQQKPSAKNLH